MGECCEVASFFLIMIELADCGEIRPAFWRPSCAQHESWLVVVQLKRWQVDNTHAHARARYTTQQPQSTT